MRNRKDVACYVTFPRSTLAWEKIGPATSMEERRDPRRKMKWL